MWPLNRKQYVIFWATDRGTPAAAARSDVLKGVGSVAGKKLAPDITHRIESQDGIDGFNLAVEGPITAETTAGPWISDLNLHHIEQHYLQREVRMIEKCRKAHQLIEERVRRPTFRRQPGLLVVAHQPGSKGDRMHDRYTELGQKVIEFVAHRPEGSGLNFNEFLIRISDTAGDVGHELIDGTLQAVPRLCIPFLQLRMKGALVERSDDGIWGCDAATLVSGEASTPSLLAAHSGRSWTGSVTINARTESSVSASETDLSSR